ncbi:hypothetical protein CYMTET_17094 [Cymbomonas tetramitiformis]|uniref:C3H1-type domain-containing protein n=1 Tax=Cymbomonas tetramitiformis TaxID=36881 RepID=A0AAE0GB37_9CHLO|nr:hypothetical protein CYMTET_17094 [Cymbomonas tetramitiformis]
MDLPSENAACPYLCFVKQSNAPAAFFRTVFDLQVCPRCVLRLLGCRDGAVFSYPPPLPRVMLASIDATPSPQASEEGTELIHEVRPCIACLGALSSFDSTPAISSDGEAPTSAMGVEEAVDIMTAEHSFSEFALNTSFPPSLLLRQRSLLYHLEQKGFASHCTVVTEPKDALKLVVVPHLEKSTGAKYNCNAAFVCCLSFTHPSSATETATLASQGAAKSSKRSWGQTQWSQQKARVCHAFQKGYCKFGARCKFAHDAKGESPSSAVTVGLPRASSLPKPLDSPSPRIVVIQAPGCCHPSPQLL